MVRRGTDMTDTSDKWTVRGVTAEAQRLAKVGAAASGWSMGTEVSEAIETYYRLKHTVEQPVAEGPKISKKRGAKKAVVEGKPQSAAPQEERREPFWKDPKKKTLL
jgi:hypothetical protein